MTIKQKKTIAIAATGGTIAGTGEAGKTAVYHAGEMNVESILETIPMIQNVADIETVQLFNVDSNEMDEEKWITLANQLNELAARPDIDGIVVTHGTDTLDETAYFLNLTVYTQKPVVLTGAMRPATATSADGPFNLYQAVCLAASDDARGQGVMAVFSNTIYSGRDIQKVIITRQMHLIRTHSAAWDICRMRLRISFPEALRHIPCSLFLLCAGWKVWRK